MSDAIARAQLVENLKHQAWRLDNLYKIKDAEGKCVPFRLNWAQRHFASSLHYFNVVLKARQLGFSTFILIYMLDAALFNPNHSCGVIAQGLKEAEDIFDNKVKFAYDNLPAWLRDNIRVVSDNAKELKFNNGSSIIVGTSMRGGTFQKLHVSEYGKIAARYPEKAKEIKTGAFNTVHAGQQLFVESTAEGMSGEFFDLVKLARRISDERRALSPLDPKFHFYPWYQNPSYALDAIDAGMVTITREDADYFESLDVQLSRGQKAWYIKKAALMGDDMKREFPSTADEAFSASLEGAYYSKQMRLVRQAGQITKVPWEPRALVHTFWDIGNFSHMPIWMMQHVGPEYRFIDFLQDVNGDLTFLANALRNTGYSFGNHYLPHDGTTKQLGFKNQSVKEMLEQLGLRNIIIVPRTSDVARDIETKCKPILPKCWFDEKKCARGIASLDAYRKQWDDKFGVWREDPRPDEHSHPADAFRTFAAGYQPVREEMHIDDDWDDDYDDTRDDARNRLSGY